jgi:hypothetical protein
VADCGKRHNTDCEILLGMPKLCWTDSSPGPGAPNDPHYLAICHMGIGPFGTLQEGAQGLTHLLIAVDKFTKWVEAKPQAKIGSKQATYFIQDIIFRFGVPNSIITNNVTQFTGEKFLDFCDDNNIRVDSAIVAHPHTNRQVECANGMILHSLKPRILTPEDEDVHARLNS